MHTICKDTDVYLRGADGAIRTPLTVEQIADRMLDVADMDQAVCFIRLSLDDDRPDALVRPAAIDALVPASRDDDD